MMNTDPVDVLAFAAHPDDVELNIGGTVATMVDQGYRVGIVDCTRGELGSRGSVESRAREAEEASHILGVHARENLGLPDGDITNTPEHRRAVIQVVRKYRPRITLIPPSECRHPDHAAASRVISDALFQSGLVRIDTGQEPWRPSHVLHYMQTLEFEPTLVVDVSAVWDRRMAAVRAFRTQFHHPDYRPEPGEPETFISDPAFLEALEARARAFGHSIGVLYGEPFLYRHGPFGVTDLVGTLSSQRAFR